MNIFVTKTIENGRLCNQIIRNIATSLIAEKNNLYVEYSSYDKITQLGIPLFIGTNMYDSNIILDENNFFENLQIYDSTIIVDENNFFEILQKSPPIYKNINTNQAFFQSKDISNYIYNYLHSEPLQTRIIDHNPYKARYNNNRDCFIHIRLGDTVNYNPGLSYYLMAIEKIIDDVDTIFVTTDSPYRNIIIDLTKIYPQKIKLFKSEEVDTIQFGSTCKYIILSHGSFSAVIGWLAYYSEIFYPEYNKDKIWFGDMFSINGWNKIKDFW